MFLVDGIEKGGRDCVVAVCFGEFTKFAETKRIAIGFAAFGEVFSGVFVDVANELIETIFVLNNEFYVDFFGIDFQAVAASNVFIHGVDVWVVPKKSRLDFFGAEGFDAVDAAWSATSVE